MAWLQEETTTLIELWGDETVQEQLQNCTRNRSIYETLSRKLETAGFTRTAIQCREKIKKLRQEYKKVKDNNGLTGRGTKRWIYFDQLDAILGHRPAMAPPIVLDTSSAEVRVERTITDNDDEPEDVTEVQPQICTVNDASTGEQLDEELGQLDKNGESNQVEEDGEENELETDKNGKKDDNGEKNLADENDENSLANRNGEKRKRKRPSKKAVVEKTIEHVMKKATKTQEESDMKLLAVEEKRLKFDELVLEMENKRWKEDREREERQCREEREFQLKVKFNVFMCV